MEWITAAIGAVAAGAVVVIGAWAKLIQVNNTHALELTKVKADMESKADEKHTAREKEAFEELKLLLKERKLETERQAARLDRLEAEHTLCEKKYDELKADSLKDKIEMGVLKAQVSNLETQLTSFKNAQNTGNQNKGSQ